MKESDIAGLRIVKDTYSDGSNVWTLEVYYADGNAWELYHRAEQREMVQWVYDDLLAHTLAKPDLVTSTIVQKWEK